MTLSLLQMVKQTAPFQDIASAPIIPSILVARHLPLSLSLATDQSANLHKHEIVKFQLHYKNPELNFIPNRQHLRDTATSAEFRV